MKLTALYYFIKVHDFQKIDQNLAGITDDEDHNNAEQSPTSTPRPLNPDLLEYPQIILLQDEDWQNYPHQEIKDCFV